MTPDEVKKALMGGANLPILGQPKPLVIPPMAKDIQKWYCKECKDEPEMVPLVHPQTGQFIGYGPRHALALQLPEDPGPTYTCARCYVKVMRDLIPMLYPLPPGLHIVKSEDVTDSPKDLPHG